MSRSSRIALNEEAAGIGIAAIGDTAGAGKRAMPIFTAGQAQMQWNCFAGMCLSAPPSAQWLAA